MIIFSFYSSIRENERYKIRESKTHNNIKVFVGYIMIINAIRIMRLIFRY